MMVTLLALMEMSIMEMGSSLIWRPENLEKKHLHFFLVRLMESQLLQVTDSVDDKTDQPFY